MTHQQIFDLITQHSGEVVPSLESHSFKATDSLRELGANSIDRAEIIMMTLEALQLSVPLIETAQAENIGELAAILAGKLEARDAG